jgi:hypothetical protein
MYGQLSKETEENQGTWSLGGNYDTKYPNMGQKFYSLNYEVPSIISHNIKRMLKKHSERAQKRL